MPSKIAINVRTERQYRFWRIVLTKNKNSLVISGGCLLFTLRVQTGLAEPPENSEMIAQHATTHRDDEMKVNDYLQYSLSSHHLYGYIHKIHKMTSSQLVYQFSTSFPSWFYLKRLKTINGHYFNINWSVCVSVFSSPLRNFISLSKHASLLNALGMRTL